MPKHTAKQPSGPSQRQLRVGEMVRHALSEMFTRGDIYDETIASHLVTVTEVRMTPDLKLATAYIMPLGGADMKPLLAALEKNKRFIRGEISHRVNLKYAPDVRFKADDTFDEAMRIEKILHSPKVRQDIEKD